MTIIKCTACENEFVLEYLKYKDICPYPYCCSRGEKAKFKIIKEQGENDGD